MRARTLLVLLGLAAATLIVWRPGGGPRREPVGVTAEIAGVWTSEAPAYAGRFLEIRADRVVFGRGEDEVSHALVGVFQEPTNAGGRQYLLVYESEDPEQAPLEMRLRCERDRLILANPPNVVWTRSP